MCGPTTCPTTPSTIRGTRALAARPAPDRLNLARMHGRVAGGGKRTGPRSAGCTVWWRRAASSTRSKCWWGASIALELAPAEQEVLAPEARALAAKMPSADGRARYERLAGAGERSARGQRRAAVVTRAAAATVAPHCGAAALRADAGDRPREAIAGAGRSGAA